MGQYNDSLMIKLMVIVKSAREIIDNYALAVGQTDCPGNNWRFYH